MSDRVAPPEHWFLRTVFAGELSEQTLTTLFASDAEQLRRQLRRRIEQALRDLSYRERGVLEMRFGLGDGHAYSLAEVGYVFKLTRERIRQIQVKALRKVHRRAEDLRNFVCELDRNSPGHS